MVEQQRQRVEQELTKMVDEIDREYLRKMQAEMHRCSARCCDDISLSMEAAQNCIQICSKGVTNAQEYVQKEIGGLQNRLQRCVMDCNDSIKDQMGPNPNDSDVQKYSMMFEKCAVKCVDKQVELIPTVMKAMKTVLRNHPANKSQHDVVLV